MKKDKKIISLHHLSASGGTIVTKLLSTSPEIYVLNEKHPLFSSHQEVFFAPSILVDELIVRYRLDASLRLRNFLEQIDFCVDIANKNERIILLRDWAHPEFFTNKDIPPGVTYKALASHFKETNVLSLVTLRHPLDTYLSARRSGFLSELRNSFPLFCEAYNKFLSFYRALPVTFRKYEEIITNPKAFLAEMGELFDVSFPDDFQAKLDLLQFSGDSGRSSSEVKLRPRLEEDGNLIREARLYSDYHDLCNTLDYPT